MMLRLRQLRTDENGELIERAAYAARANGQHRIAGLRFAQEKLDAHLHVAGEYDVFVAGGTDGHCEGLAIHVLDGRFAGGVNIGDDQNIGLIEGLAEFIPQMLCARIAMWLEDDQQTLESAAARGFESGANFGGMMAVIVDQRDAVVHAFDFETTADAAEFFEALSNQF